ncbi:hypothetical protein E4U61_005262, partial [Claviceps capensis]
ALQSVLAGVYRDFVDLQLQLMDYKLKYGNPRSRLFPLTANLGGPGDVGDHRSPATFLVPFTPELARFPDSILMQVDGQTSTSKSILIRALIVKLGQFVINGDGDH